MEESKVTAAATWKNDLDLDSLDAVEVIWSVIFMMYTLLGCNGYWGGVCNWDPRFWGWPNCFCLCFLNFESPHVSLILSSFLSKMQLITLLTIPWPNKKINQKIIQLYNTKIVTLIESESFQFLFLILLLELFSTRPWFYPFNYYFFSYSKVIHCFLLTENIAFYF